MTSKSVLVILCLSILYACSLSSQKEGIYVENELRSPEIPFEELFDSLQIERLDFSTKCIQNEVSKIQLQGNYLFMFDAFKSGKLCIYDRERQSYKIIDSEILFDMFYKETKIVDFETTPESVLVLTKNPSHLLVYDLEMNLQKTLPLAFRARNFKILPNNDLIFYKTLDAEEGESSDYFYHLIRTDPTGKFIEGRYPFTIPEGQRVYIDLNYPLGNYGQYVSYNKTFSDTVFVISNSLSTFHDKIVVGLKHKVLDKQEYNKPEMFNKIQSDRDLHNPLGLVNFIADDHSLSFSLA